MFDKEQFTYYEETHLGFYKGELVPSITQLIEILFPLDSKISRERLKKAADRGTTIHNAIEEFNKSFIIGQPMDIDKSECAELKDYYFLLCAFHLKPVCAEKIIFLCDEQGELICYGHFDFVFECCGTTELFKNGEYYLGDAKTTCTFDKKKTKLQTQIYRVARNQECETQLNGMTFGVWLRDGNANIYPFEKVEDKAVIDTCKTLRKIWNERQQNNESN